MLHMVMAARIEPSGYPVKAAIPEDDPAWLAAMNAPFDDTPDTEQELADVAEARKTGRFISSGEMSRSIAARRP